MLSEKQKKLLCSRLPRTTIVEGCISSGKTFICNHKAVKQIIENFTNTGLIFFIGRTLTTLERNVLLPLEMQYGREMFTYSLNQKRAKLCGYRIELEGCNDITSETKLRGATAEFIYGDEITLWNKPFMLRCFGSLRTENATALFSTNPDSPSHFVKTEFLDRRDVLNLQSIKFNMDDNPVLTEEYKRQIKLEYTGVFYQRFIEGLWVLAEGLIYPDYRVAIVPTEPRRYTDYQVSLDYGTSNPFAAGLWGLCNNVWYMISEYYYSGREKSIQKTDDDYFKDLKQFVGDRPLRYVIVDPSAASFITLLRKNGWPARGADNTVVDGIRQTAAAMQQGKIKINDCCVNIIREFGLYAWNPDSSVDEPIDESNHACDAARYFCVTNRLVTGQTRLHAS